MGDCHLNASTDSGTFINSSQGMGFPPKVFIDSDTDQDIPPHIPILEDYCRKMSVWKGQMFLQAHVQLKWGAYRHHAARPSKPRQ